MKKNSKEKAIERHLRNGRTITQQDAIRKYRHYRLAVVINRLRNKGSIIETNMRTRHGSTFAEYKMVWP